MSNSWTPLYNTDTDQWQMPLPASTDPSHRIFQSGAPEDLNIHPENMDVPPEQIQTDSQGWTISGNPT